jgi:histidine triad (HIT) family protein
MLESSMNDCIFCNIINRTIKADIFYENDQIIAIKDRAPKAPIHYLIIPKIHVQDIQSIESKDLVIAEELFKGAQVLSKKIPGAHHFKFVINSGYDAGQRVFHLHAHFLAGGLQGEV